MKTDEALLIIDLMRSTISTFWKIAGIPVADECSTITAKLEELKTKIQRGQIKTIQ